MYIRRNDPRRRLHTTHFPSCPPMWPCLMWSSRLLIFFSRDFIPPLAPWITPSVSLNICVFHSSWVGSCGSSARSLVSPSGDGSRWSAIWCCGIPKFIGTYGFDECASMLWLMLVNSLLSWDHMILRGEYFAYIMIPIFDMPMGHICD